MALDAVVNEQRRGDASCFVDTTRWTPCLEQRMFDLLGLGNSQNLAGTSDKLDTDIQPILIYNPCPTGQHIVTISTAEVGSNSWRC